MGTRPRGGDEGGADVIALGQGGQALNVDSEESAEGVGLGLAQLGELSCDVLDGTVTLAQLQADDVTVTDRACTGCVAFDAQCLDERLGAGPGVISGRLELGGTPLLERADALVGEGTHGLLADALAQETHGVGGQVVVVGGQTVVTDVTHDPLAGGAATAPLAGVRCAAGDGSTLGQLVQVATHAGGGEPEQGGQVGGRDGPTLADHGQDAVTRAGITSRVVGVRRQPRSSLGNNHTSMLRNCATRTTKAALTMAGRATCLDSPVVTRAVVVEDLRRVFGELVAVDGASWGASTGEVTCVLGPNGAGKTTTIECLEGLQRPDSGSCHVLGVDPWQANADHRARVGVMLQDGGLPQSVSARRLLTHLQRLYRTHRADELIERLDIAPFAGTPVRRLSGGQRQRVALAAALLGDPQVAFLDEPTAGLDPHARIAVWDLVRERRDEGTALVVTTHGFDEAERLADRVVILDRGRVVADDTPAAIAAGGRLEDAYFSLTGGSRG